MATEGFLIRVWCRDCSGDDEQGCFGGGSELQGNAILRDLLRATDPRCFGGDSELQGNGYTDNGFGDSVPFATYEEAERFGHKVTSGPPWDFEVTDCAGVLVERPA